MEQSVKHSGLVIAFDCLFWKLPWHAEKIAAYEAQVSSVGGIYFVANGFFDRVSFDMYANRGINELCADGTPNIMA